MDRLFHISDNGLIDCFEPRPPPSFDAGVTDDVVWAIDELHLVNYLLPRDCPRVTFYPTERNSIEVVEKLTGVKRDQHVVAIEDTWFQRAIEAVLWLYELPVSSFEVVDQGAGYYVSRQTVVPLSKRKIKNPLLELLSRGAELRVVDSLWPLRDGVIALELQYSIIRMRNAKPRVAEVPTEASAT